MTRAQWRQSHGGLGGRSWKTGVVFRVFGVSFRFESSPVLTSGGALSLRERPKRLALPKVVPADRNLVPLPWRRWVVELHRKASRLLYRHTTGGGSGFKDPRAEGRRGLERRGRLHGRRSHRRAERPPAQGPHQGPRQETHRSLRPPTQTAPPSWWAPARLPKHCRHFHFVRDVLFSRPPKSIFDGPFKKERLSRNIVHFLEALQNLISIAIAIQASGAGARVVEAGGCSLGMSSVCVRPPFVTCAICKQKVNRADFTSKHLPACRDRRQKQKNFTSGGVQLGKSLQKSGGSPNAEKGG